MRATETPMDTTLKASLRELESRHLLRRLRTLEGAQGPRMRLEGREVVILASNNYLGLAGDPRLKEAAARAAREFGTGAGASRLITGSMALHRELEERLAAFKKKEAALLMGSGYLANIGLIPSLAGEGDLILSDELNHASLVDGCRLSRARTSVYPHKDLKELSRLLREAPQEGRKLIVTDGVFSMDGDLAPLPEVVSLARESRAWVLLDDAHATGVQGPSGGGTAEHFGIEGGVEVTMGTLSKALGSYGAFVCGSRALIEFLINRCRSFIYSTALPPPPVAAALAALEILEEEPERRAALWDNTDYLRGGLKSLGFRLGQSQTPILPVHVGKARAALKMAELLLERGVFAVAIRPPTVPEGTSRLRLTPMATHSREDLDRALEALEQAGREVGII